MDYDFDIYIAGPMTGRPLFNHPAFNAAEAKYAALGYRVFNPAKNGLPPESPWREHMRVDIAALLRSRSVVLLDGWMDSRGANIEHDIAAAVGAPLFLDRIVVGADLCAILGEPLAPQQAAPATPQKPELRVGQIWRTRGGACRGGFIARIEAKTTNPKYPFLCVTDDHYRWTVTEDGRYWNNGVNATEDLIELISDVPQEGGEA